MPSVHCSTYLVLLIGRYGTRLIQNFWTAPCRKQMMHSNWTRLQILHSNGTMSQILHSTETLAIIAKPLSHIMHSDYTLSQILYRQFCIVTTMSQILHVNCIMSHVLHCKYYEIVKLWLNTPQPITAYQRALLALNLFAANQLVQNKWLHIMLEDLFDHWLTRVTP